MIEARHKFTCGILWTDSPISMTCNVPYFISNTGYHSG